MDIKSLLHLGCAKIATLIKGKSPDEIKQIMQASDFTNLLRKLYIVFYKNNY